MKILLSFFITILVATHAATAEAVTIRNKCDYPVAGSLTVAESNVSVAQFRIIPGEKVHLLRNIGKTKLILKIIPDVYDMEKLIISSADVITPDCFIELKSDHNGIKVKIE